MNNMNTQPPTTGFITALLDDGRNEWTVHTAANGLPFYYNKKTKKSTWEKPDCLKTPEERLNSTDWQEFTTSDGRTFYYNAKLKKSLWNMPPELKAIKEKQAELRKQIAAKSVEIKPSTQAPAKINISFTTLIQPDELKDEKKDKYDNLSQEEAEKIFMELLKEKANPSIKWDAAHQILMNDERYKVIKSVSEKKKLFKDFVANIKKEERKELKNKMDQARQNFLTMLENAKTLNSDSKYYKVFPQFVNDSRWKALDERERENLFQNYLDELYDKEKEEKRSIKKDLTEKLRELLTNDKEVTSATKWDEISQKLKENNIWNGLHEYDRLTVFSEHVINLERIENEERRKNKRLTERLNRESFRELLREYIAKGELTHKTKWKNFLSQIRDDSRLLNMIGQNGSTPRELFEDQIEVLQETHKKHKEDFKKMIKDSGMLFNPSTTFEEFDTNLTPFENYTAMEEKTRQFFFNYFIGKAKSKEKETIKKHKKAIKKYTKLLKKMNLNIDTQYKDIEPQIKEAGEPFNLLSEEEKIKYLNEFIQELKNKDEGQISDEDFERSKKKKNKKKKRTRRQDDSDLSDGEHHKEEIDDTRGRDKLSQSNRSRSISDSSLRMPKSEKKRKYKKERKRSADKEESEGETSAQEIRKKIKTEENSKVSGDNQVSSQVQQQQQAQQAQQVQQQQLNSGNQEIEVKSQPQEIEVKYQPEDIEVKFQVENIEVKNQPDMEVRYQVENVEVKYQPLDMEIKQQIQEIDVKIQPQETEARYQFQEADVKIENIGENQIFLDPLRDLKLAIAQITQEEIGMDEQKVEVKEEAANMISEMGKSLALPMKEVSESMQPPQEVTQDMSNEALKSIPENLKPPQSQQPQQQPPQQQQQPQPQQQPQQQQQPPQDQTKEQPLSKVPETTAATNPPSKKPELKSRSRSRSRSKSKSRTKSRSRNKKKKSERKHTSKKKSKKDKEEKKHKKKHKKRAHSSDEESSNE